MDCSFGKNRTGQWYLAYCSCRSARTEISADGVFRGIILKHICCLAWLVFSTSVCSHSLFYACVLKEWTEEHAYLYMRPQIYALCLSFLCLYIFCRCLFPIGMSIFSLCFSFTFYKLYLSLTTCLFEKNILSKLHISCQYSIIHILFANVLSGKNLDHKISCGLLKNSLYILKRSRFLQAYSLTWNKR